MNGYTYLKTRLEYAVSSMKLRDEVRTPMSSEKSRDF